MSIKDPGTIEFQHDLATDHLRTLINDASKNSPWTPQRVTTLETALELLKTQAGIYVDDEIWRSKYGTLIDLSRSLFAAAAGQKGAKVAEVGDITRAIKKILVDWLYLQLNENWEAVAAVLGEDLKPAPGQPVELVKLRAWVGDSTAHETNKIVALLEEKGHALQKGKGAPSPYEQLVKLLSTPPAEEPAEDKPGDKPTEEATVATEEKKKKKPEGQGAIRSLSNTVHTIQVWSEASRERARDTANASQAIVDSVLQVAQDSGAFVDSAFNKGRFFAENGDVTALKDEGIIKALKVLFHKLHTNKQKVAWNGLSAVLPEDAQPAFEVALKKLVGHYMLATGRMEGLSPFCRKADLERVGATLKDLKAEAFAGLLGSIEHVEELDKDREAFSKKILAKVQKLFKKLKGKKDPARAFLRLFSEMEHMKRIACRDARRLLGQEDVFDMQVPLIATGSVPMTPIARALREEGETNYFSLAWIDEQFVVDYAAFVWLKEELKTTLFYDWNEVKVKAGEPGHQCALSQEVDKGHHQVAARLVYELGQLHTVSKDKTKEKLIPYSSDQAAVRRIAWFLVGSMFNVMAGRNFLGQEGTKPTMTIEEARCYQALSSSAKCKAMVKKKGLKEKDSLYVLHVGGTAIFIGARQTVRWFLRIPGAVYNVGAAGVTKLISWLSKENKAKWHDDSVRYWEVAKGLVIQFVKTPALYLKNLATGAWDWVSGKVKGKAGSIWAGARDYLLNQRDSDGNILDEREDFVHLLYKVPCRVVTGAAGLVWGGIKSFFGGIWGLFFGGGGSKQTAVAVVPSSQ
jgi:hypothetical protein